MLEVDHYLVLPVVPGGLHPDLDHVGWLGRQDGQRTSSHSYIEEKLKSLQQS